MKTTISIIIVVALFFYIAETKVQFSPFKVTFGNISLAFAWMFLWLSVITMTYSVHKKAYEEGLKKGAEITHEDVIKVAKEIIEESKEPQQ